MDKQTLSNYGWIVIAVLVLSVMIALATPFGQYVKLGAENTLFGLIDTSDNALDVVKPITYIDFEVTSNNRHLVGYSGEENENLVIPATFKDGDKWYKVTSLSGNYGTAAFLDCTSLTSIVIPDSVTSIGDHAFSYCYSLTSIVIPNSVTSIGESAFRDCSSLTSVTIPDGVTTINNFAFFGCYNMENLTIPKTVTSIGNGAFILGEGNLLEVITYNGTKEQWNNITKHEDWGGHAILCTDGLIP